MHRVAFVFVACSALILGCSSFKGQNESEKNSSLGLLKERNASKQGGEGKDREWLSHNYVERMIKEQNSSASNLEEKQRDLLDLQKRADVLIKLIDQERINVLEAPTQSGLSTGVLPISDLRKRLSSNQASIRLAVVVVPVEGPQIDEGKPDVLSLVQEIDKTLRNAGINRRVFECFDDRGALELDSADLGAHAPPGP